jgi:ferredoxin-NADP reductase
VVLSDRDGTFVRPYSVVDSDRSKLTFCIRISEGRGGNALKKLKVGDTLRIENVSGSFVLRPTDSKKAFIATGTGLAPIVNMMSHIPETEKILLFGVRDSESRFYADRLAKIPNLKTVTYLSRETAAGFETGRIDVTKLDFPEGCEFYVCGNPQLVESSVKALKSRGFEHIYHEKF